MPRKRFTIDERPGPLPAIRTDGQSVTFEMTVKDADSRLILRCDTNGAVWASIAERRTTSEWWWTA